MGVRHSAAIDTVFAAILSLRTQQECYQFFEDLCTVKEILEMAQRFGVARKLDAGKIYSEVAAETGASTSTISRVNRCLHYGSGGYRLVLDREKAHREVMGERHDA